MIKKSVIFFLSSLAQAMMQPPELPRFHAVYQHHNGKKYKVLAFSWEFHGSCNVICVPIDNDFFQVCHVPLEEFNEVKAWTKKDQPSPRFKLVK